VHWAQTLAELAPARVWAKQSERAQAMFNQLRIEPETADLFKRGRARAEGTTSTHGLALALNAA